MTLRLSHKFRRKKLLEALITEKMKPQIVETTPEIQLGGMPTSQSVKHIVTVKIWIKQIEENKSKGIVESHIMLLVYFY